MALGAGVWVLHGPDAGDLPLDYPRSGSWVFWNRRQRRGAKLTNPAGAVDAPMSILFHTFGLGRCATDQRRWPEPKVVYVILSSTE